MQTPKVLEKGHDFCGRGFFSFYKRALQVLLGLGRDLVFDHGTPSNCKSAAALHELGIFRSNKL